MKKVALIFILLASTAFHAFGQDQHTIDSLTRLLGNDVSENDADVLYELIFEYGESSPLIALEYANQGLPIVYKSGDSLKIVKFNRVKAQLLRRLGRQPEAMAIIENTLPIASRNGFRREVGFMLTTLAFCETLAGNYDKALEHNFRATEIFTETGDPLTSSSIINNIGLIHYKIGNYDKSIEYFKRSLDVAIKHGANSILPVNYSNIGMALIFKKEFKESEEWLLKSIELCGPECRAEVRTANEYGLGYLEFNNKRFAVAKEHFEKSYQTAVQNDDLRFQTENLVMFSKIETLNGNLDRAEKLMHESVELAIKGNYRPLLASAYLGLHKIYKKTNNVSKASSFLEKYVVLQDSIYSIDVRNKIMVAQTEFEERENKMLIAHSQALLEKKNLQTKLVIAVCILSLVTAVTLFVILRSKLKANKMLDERVVDRTRELELHKEALERSHAEQRELISKTAQSIKNVAATQKGLSAISENNIIMQRMEEELQKLNEEIAKAQNMSDSTGTK